jgi:hypothetical protein
MSAIISDNFRILNASNFVESIEDASNSYYVFLGLSNPSIIGFGRTTTWNEDPPTPIDNLNYFNHYSDTIIFGKKLVSNNVRRLVKRVNWVKGTRYDMYRHDYSILNPAPISQASRLYDANYFVINSDYRVYICIDNGSSGTNLKGNASQDQPTFTDLEPSRAGESGDGYVWKYLFTVLPSDIIKFDSTDYVVVPNNWDTTTDAQIQPIRENGDSDVNTNQIKKVYIENAGLGYANVGEVEIVGDGTGGKVLITVDSSGRITDAVVTSGGSGYTYGVVDLKTTSLNAPQTLAKLIPIIPPSKGHGYDIYTELGADRVLLYSRFDDSTKDFPTDTKFSQVGVIKNPQYLQSNNIFSEDQFSSLYSLKIRTSPSPGTITIGDVIRQQVSGGIAYGYVSSYDIDTGVLKYYQDRSLYFNTSTLDETDYVGISTSAKVLPFESSANTIVSTTFSGSIDTNFSGITTNPTGNAIINLGVNFTNGLANPEINKKTGQIIYLDNRALISRNSRQKEDIKIILEF